MRLNDDAKSACAKFAAALGCVTLGCGVPIVFLAALLVPACATSTFNTETEEQRQSLTEAERKERQEAKNRFVRQFTEPTIKKTLAKTEVEFRPVRSALLVSAIGSGMPVTSPAGLNFAGAIVLEDAALYQAVSQGSGPKPDPEIVARFVAVCGPLGLFGTPGTK